MQGLHLLTRNTPNGQRAQIMLEELKELYGTDFTTTIINLKAGEQKEEWFLRINPNGPLLRYSFPEILLDTLFFFSPFSFYLLEQFLTMRGGSTIIGCIPTLVDNSQSPPYTVMESAAQILYLSEVYDKNSEFSFKDPIERNDAYQWLLFWHGSGAPSVFQWAYFSFIAQERNAGTYRYAHDSLINSKAWKERVPG